MRIFIAGLVLVASSSIASAQDWAQWRGPGRDGAVAPAAVLRQRWPSGGATRTWRVEVGEGYSSPVVAGGRVFVHGRRDPEELVTAVDFQTGKVLLAAEVSGAGFAEESVRRCAWPRGPTRRRSWPAAMSTRSASPACCPAWRVGDGTLAWRKDYSAAVNTSQLFCGTAMSPLIEGGNLIVQVGSDVHGGRVIAIDPATGTERWTWEGAPDPATRRRLPSPLQACANS